MPDRGIIDMIEALRGSAPNSGMVLRHATVASVEPLAIRAHDVTITRNLYINPALTLAGANNQLTEIFEAADSGQPPEIFAFLRDFCVAYVLHPGDGVVVLEDGVSFYVLCKAVGV